MQDAPDLSKIVSLIMQNPELIEQISRLAKSDTPSEEISSAESEKSVLSEAVTTVSEPKETYFGARERRQDLLNAMKPYLSESRRTAIDSMMSIADILDIMRKAR